MVAVVILPGDRRTVVMPMALLLGDGAAVDDVISVSGHTAGFRWRSISGPLWPSGAWAEAAVWVGQRPSDLKGEGIRRLRDPRQRSQRRDEALMANCARVGAEIGSIAPR